MILMLCGLRVKREAVDIELRLLSITAAGLDRAAFDGIEPRFVDRWARFGASGMLAV